MEELTVEQERFYWYWLCNIQGVGNKTIERLLGRYDHPWVVYEKVNDSELTKLQIKPTVRSRILESREEKRILTEMSYLKEKGIDFIYYREEERYPEKLAHIYDPPYCLYVRGKMPEESKLSIAIVGARTCTNYGKELAYYFGKALAEQGVQIISGMASGIDGYAQRGAIRELGKSFGILGCGVDLCFPQENFNLYMDLIERGGVISEYSPGTCGRPGNFPMRNRIISGLCDGILVVEARKKSGSLITVDRGLEQGKNIYACPGRIMDAVSSGCNHMIQQGAKLVLTVDDILEDYGFLRDSSELNYKKNRNKLETKEKIVYDKLSLIPKHLEKIIEETQYSVEETTQLLLSLQLKGYIKSIAGNYYTCILMDL